jgi:hypothetical protein
MRNGWRCRRLHLDHMMALAAQGVHDRYLPEPFRRFEPRCSHFDLIELNGDDLRRDHAVRKVVGHSRGSGRLQDAPIVPGAAKIIAPGKQEVRAPIIPHLLQTIGGHSGWLLLAWPLQLADRIDQRRRTSAEMLSSVGMNAARFTRSRRNISATSGTCS